MNLDLEQMRSYWNCCSTHWRGDSSFESTGVNRHRIPSRAVAHEFFKRGARTWSDKIRQPLNFNIAARLAAIYDLFLGREDPKPFLVERSRRDAQRAAD